MKKRKPQSQRKNIPKTLHQGNIFKNNKNNLNTFRQNKDNKILSNKDKKHLNTSHKESPKTIDYMQIMNKYSHLIEQNQENISKNIDENNIFKFNNYYIKTEYNQDKNIDMTNALHFSSNNNIHMSNNNNAHDDYFQFCRTDYGKIEKEESQNNFKYHTLKNFYQKKKNITDAYSGKNNIKNNNNNYIKNEDNKNNNIFNSYSKNKKSKNRESYYYTNMNNTNYNTHHFNNNINNSVSLKKMSKKNNSTNSHSLSNININRPNIYRNNDSNNYINTNLRTNNISSTNNILNNKNKNEEIKDINQKMFNYNYYSEKIITLITICQKYAKALNSSITFIELNNNISNESFDELKYIITQYNRLMFSEKINNFFNYKNNNYLSNFNLNEFEPKTLNLTEKFKIKIKDLKTEKSDLNDELNLYKKKNKTLLLEKEELDLIIKKLSKENEELCIQNKNLKSLENKYYHQNNMIDKLKCQIETLNVDIKYKENIITNLQQILEQIKVKSNLINYTNDSDNIKINSNKNMNNNFNFTNNNKKMSLKELGNEHIINGINNISDFLMDVNSESIEKDIIFPKNLKVNSIEDMNSINIEEIDKKNNDSEIIINNNKKESEKDILKLKQNLKGKNYNNSNNIYKKTKLYFNENEHPEILTKEMEKIDQDILNLKTKLKRIITK